MPSMPATNITITQCDPIHITETEQGWHVVGTVGGVKFITVVDDVGNETEGGIEWASWDPMPREVSAAILAAIETAIIMSGAPSHDLVEAREWSAGLDSPEATCFTSAIAITSSPRTWNPRGRNAAN